MKIFKLKNLVPKGNGHDFYKDTAILTIGVTLAQFIPIIAYPVISRLYSPADFGILATITSVTSILSILATLKYENSILITCNKKVASNFIIAIVLISIVFLLAISILLFLISDIFVDILNAPGIKPWLWVCPISAFCVVLYNCFNEWCVRNGYFKSLSVNKIINGGSIPVCKIVFAFGRFSPIGLIIGDLFGHFITGCSCLIRALTFDRILFLHPSKRLMKYSLKRYSDSPKFVLPAQLLNKLGFELPVFFMMAYFSAEDLGFYAMAVMVLSLPTSMISRAIRDTFRKRANDIYTQEGHCIDFYRRVLIPMAMVSVVGFTVFYFMAPDLLVFILGEKWRIAGLCCQLLCPMVAINFVSEVGNSMYIIVEKMGLLLVWQAFYFVMTIAAMLLGTIVFQDFKTTLICLMIFRCVVYSADILITSRLAKYGTLFCKKRNSR